jgi:pyridoxamine 5'-phosphate oxidase
MHHKVAELRQEYTNRDLSEQTVDSNPIEQFNLWFHEAMECQVKEPNAMSLSTANKNGRPSCRIVLLKAFNEDGFVFFTNYSSNKGVDLDENPFAALTFLWLDLERQVRIEGRVEKIPEAESDDYFYSRPYASRIGAWASPQSKPVTRRELIDNERDFAQKFNGDAIPRPHHWGGYIVIPDMIEFWQGGAARLHDRIVYYKTPEGWRIERLAP